MGSRGRAVTGAASVLCVGQATLDHVLTVADPVVVGRKHVAQRHDVVGGGLAANAAVAVARLGGAAALASVIGDDETGTGVLAGLRAEHVDTSLVQQVADVATPFSAVIVSADGARTIVNHSPTELLAQSCPDLEGVVCDAVLVDGRWQAGTTAALSLARRRGIPGVVDVDRSTVDAAVLATCLDLASHLIFSEDALRDLAGTPSAADGLRRVSRDTGAHVAVTLGARGVVWIDGDDVRSLDAFAIDAVDTTGAGDVFHGAAALALAEGADEARAFAFASAAAALKCTRPGARAGIASRLEVDDLLDRTPIASEVAAP
jgi:sulfofructose kinase